ncbi:MAG: hypothetical protein EHM21_16785, partial [Chloroflexi bacterium]
MRQTTYTLISVSLVGAIATAASAAEIGHYAPGVANIRDLAVPEPGFYVAVYNYGYLSDRLNDSQGNELSSVALGPNQGVNLNVSVDVSAYALAPMLIWGSSFKVLGAKYAAFVSPTFTNTSLNALISRATGAGRSASTAQFNVGDIFAQPVWLGWSKKHYEIAYGYGFYIPSGKYTIETVNLPVAGPVRVEAANNTGFGFWTNQNQGALYIYPWSDRRMGIQNALTWELHRQKRGFDLTPGQTLTYNWGVSQYLPLKKDLTLLAEIGPSGYSSFQISDDDGTAARNPSVHDRVHAVGVQVGITVPKRGIVFNFRWLHEFSAVDRFQGS